jgi:hypothetical protein
MEPLAVVRCLIGLVYFKYNLGNNGTFFLFKASMMLTSNEFCYH